MVAVRQHAGVFLFAQAEILRVFFLREAFKKLKHPFDGAFGGLAFALDLRGGNFVFRAGEQKFRYFVKSQVSVIRFFHRLLGKKGGRLDEVSFSLRGRQGQRVYAGGQVGALFGSGRGLLEQNIVYRIKRLGVIKRVVFNAVLFQVPNVGVEGAFQKGAVRAFGGGKLGGADFFQVFAHGAQGA